MQSFQQLGLSDNILKGLQSLGFETPTPIQAEAIPHLLYGEKDFIGLAQTGTGKTAAFGLPLLELMDPDAPVTQALILAPTRELGQQIAQQIDLFCKFLPKINVLAVYGGASISNQIKDLRSPRQIIIATPGRLIDLINRKKIKLDQVKYVILDEADEMLNMGFKEDLDTILSHTPADKRTWLFSATMPSGIRSIVKRYMDNPVEAKVNTKNEVNTNITHRFAVVKNANKMEALTRFVDMDPNMRALVFCRTRRETQELAETLMTKSYRVDAIHGDLSQQQRDRVLKRFKANELQLLIATDVASRGIDVQDLTHVFHHTLPDDLTQYTHRSGRTARAGRKGTSIALVNGREMARINRLTSQLKISFEKITIPDYSNIAETRITQWSKHIAQNGKGVIDPKLMNKVKSIFADLSKEELIEKLVLTEFSSMQSSDQGDLNEGVSQGGGRRDSRGGDSRSRDNNRPRRNKSRRNSGGSEPKSFHGKSKRGPKKNHRKGPSSKSRRNTIA